MKPFITWTLLMVYLSPAHATSIVALIQPNRILLAADSRSMTEDFTVPKKDDTCKIVPFANAAFADSGISSTLHKDDESVAWSASSVAKDVYAEHRDNILDASMEWTQRSVSFWTPYFSHQIKDGEKLLKSNGPDVSTSVFAGFFQGRPRVIIGRVHVNLKEGPPRKPDPVVNILTPQADPLTSNPVTQELVNGKTDRAKAAQAEWDRTAKLIKPADLDFRRLEFLIQKAARYDPHVDRTVNVLEISLDKAPRWLQNLTCK